MAAYYKVKQPWHWIIRFCSRALRERKAVSEKGNWNGNTHPKPALLTAHKIKQIIVSVDWVRCIILPNMNSSHLVSNRHSLSRWEILPPHSPWAGKKRFVEHGCLSWVSVLLVVWARLSVLTSYSLVFRCTLALPKSSSRSPVYQLLIPGPVSLYRVVKQPL